MVEIDGVQVPYMGDEYLRLTLPRKYRMTQAEIDHLSPEGRLALQKMYAERDQARASLSPSEQEERG